MEKLVGFVGYECEDIVLYLAKVLSCLGKKVAIVDRTEQEMLLEMLEIPRGKEGREGNCFELCITNQGVRDEEFDMVFYLFGYRLVHPKLYECGMLIMITDGVPAHAALLRKIGSWSRRQYLLIRNLVPMKHTEHYLALLADNEKNYFEIPYEETDIQIRYSLGSHEELGIKNLSHGMKKAVLVLARFIMPGYQDRFLWEIMRKM